MARILLLGGAGYFCRQLLPELLKSLPREWEFVIADYEYRAARKMAKKLGERVTARMVDVSDPAAMERLLEGADAGVNFVGPWYRFGKFVREAFRRAGVSLIAVNPSSFRESHGNAGGPPFVGGVSFVPAVPLIFREVFGPEKGVSVSVRVDFRNYGGQGGLREYVNFLSERPEERERGGFFAVCAEEVGFFQKVASRRRGKGVFREFVSALAEMRRNPRPSPPEEAVSVTLSRGGEVVGRYTWSQVRSVSLCLIVRAIEGVLEGRVGKLEDLLGQERVREEVLNLLGAGKHEINKKEVKR